MDSTYILKSNELKLKAQFMMILITVISLQCKKVSHNANCLIIYMILTISYRLHDKLTMLCNIFNPLFLSAKPFSVVMTVSARKLSRPDVGSSQKITA